MKNRTAVRCTAVFSLIFIGCCLFLISCSPPPPGNSADGARWFAMHHCDSCHGDGGDGGKAPVLRNNRLAYSTLFSKVRKPKSAIMPSYPEKDLSDGQVADIFTYLQESK